MHVFDDLVAFEVVGGHQSIKMAHGTVQHAGVPRALLFPAPIVQSLRRASSMTMRISTTSVS